MLKVSWKSLKIVRVILPTDSRWHILLSRCKYCHSLPLMTPCIPLVPFLYHLLPPSYPLYTPSMPLIAPSIPLLPFLIPFYTPYYPFDTLYDLFYIPSYSVIIPCRPLITPLRVILPTDGRPEVKTYHPWQWGKYWYSHHASLNVQSSGEYK